MVTYLSKKAFRFDGAQSVDLADIRCLSVDVKPTQGVANGSSLLEMDTGKLYFFDEENAEWLNFAGGDE